jgi:hypothetical protein
MLRTIGIAALIVTLETSSSLASQCKRIPNDTDHCFTQKQVDRFNYCMWSGMGKHRRETERGFCYGWM